MFNTVSESNADEDLGSGGAMVVPNFKDSNRVVHKLVVGAGKDQNIYLANRANMGKFNPSNNNQHLSGTHRGVERAGIFGAGFARTTEFITAPSATPSRRFRSTPTRC